MTGSVWMPAQVSLQQVRAVLKPSTSCSWPSTTVSFARGVAVAVAATEANASTIPATTHTRFRIGEAR